MKYGRLYHTIRREILQHKEMIKDGMISSKEASKIGISRSKIAKWEKEEKLYHANDGRIKLYNLNRLRNLMIEELKISKESGNER